MCWIVSLLLAGACFAGVEKEPGVSEPMPVKSFEDLVYAEVDGRELCLDLFLPQRVEAPPLLLWIHGGGWRQGSRKNCRIKWAVDHGFAVASLSYRFTDTAIFPAQIHDCKGALRWLRAHAEDYGFDATRVAAAGSSAGGHLAALLGVAGGVPELEGDVGGNLEQSSRVQAVLDYFGPTDFLLRLKTQPEFANSRECGSFGLLGGLRTGHVDLDLARLASPVTHVSADDPPLLILHGKADTRVLPDQARRLAEVYAQHNLPVELCLVDGVGHGGKGKKLFAGAYREKALAFLREHLGDSRR